MASDVVHLVRRAYGSWNSDGLPGLEPWLAQDVELHDAPEMPDAGVVAGRDAVLARLGDVAATMGGGWADLHDFRAIGNAVVVSMTWQTDEAAGGPAFGDVFHVVTVADGKITRLRVFLDEAAAGAAAAS